MSRELPHRCPKCKMLDTGLVILHAPLAVMQEGLYPQPQETEVTLLCRKCNHQVKLLTTSGALDPDIEAALWERYPEFKPPSKSLTQSMGLGLIQDAFQAMTPYADAIIEHCSAIVDNDDRIEMRRHAMLIQDEISNISNLLHAMTKKIEEIYGTTDQDGGG